MQEIHNLVNRTASLIGSGPTTPPEQQSGKRLYRVKGKLLTVTEILWERFVDVYGAAFVKQFGESPTEGWELAIAELTPEMIKTGLSRMAVNPEFATFPPKALEFRALCLPTPESLGLPAKDEAFQQAVGRCTDKHPAVVWALRQVDSWSFQRLPAADARKQWDALWARVVDHVLAGGELPEPIKQIEEQREPKADEETGSRFFSGMKGMFA